MVIGGEIVKGTEKYNINLMPRYKEGKTMDKKFELLKDIYIRL